MNIKRSSRRKAFIQETVRRPSSGEKGPYFLKVQSNSWKKGKTLNKEVVYCLL